MKLSKLSLKNRLILIFSLTFTIFFSTYTKIQIDSLHDTMKHTIEEDMESLATFLSAMVETEVSGEDNTKADIKKYIKNKLIPILSQLRDEMFGASGLLVLIMDDNRNILTSSEHLAPWSTKEWSTLKIGKPQFYSQEFEGIEYLSGRFLYSIAGKYTIGMELALDIQEPEEFRSLSSNIMWGLIIGIGISVFISVLLTPITFSHIRRMTEDTSEISAKNLDRRIELPESRDELHNLGKVINSMLDRIATAFESQKRFVADASHELKTPLTIMQAELELALRNAETEELRESIISVLNEIEHMTGLTSQLLALVKLDSTVINRTDEEFMLDELVSDSVRSVSPITTGRDIEIVCNIESGLVIKAAFNSIKRLLLNILDNAIKYSASGSTIKLDLHSSEDNSVNLIIEDQGYGMDSKVLENIFKPFYRAPSTRTEVSGTGLGLPIVKKIVDMHNGEISISSTPGKGTRVSVRLKKVIDSIQ